MASPPPLPLVVSIAVASVEDTVEASSVVVLTVEAGFLLPLTGPMETFLMPGTSALTSSPASPGSRALLLAAKEWAQ